MSASCRYNPIKTIKTSILGTMNMLGLAKRTRARFLLTSTSEVLLPCPCLIRCHNVKNLARADRHKLGIEPQQGPNQGLFKTILYRRKCRVSWALSKWHNFHQCLQPHAKCCMKHHTGSLIVKSSGSIVHFQQICLSLASEALWIRQTNGFQGRIHCNFSVQWSDSSAMECDHDIGWSTFVVRQKLVASWWSESHLQKHLSRSFLSHDHPMLLYV